MGEYLNRHESLSDAIMMWSILKDRIKSKNDKKSRNSLMNSIAGLVELELQYV